MMLENYDPLIVFNEKISTVNDKIQHETSQVREFLNELFLQTSKESEIKKKYCQVCLARHVSFEGHHVQGRKHGYCQITACIPCHNTLTLWQNLWDDRWQHETDSDVLKRSFLFHGIHDVLRLMSIKRQNSLYSDIADSIIHTTAYLQKSEQN